VFEGIAHITPSEPVFLGWLSLLNRLLLLLGVNRPRGRRLVLGVLWLLLAPRSRGSVALWRLRRSRRGIVNGCRVGRRGGGRRGRWHWFGGGGDGFDVLQRQEQGAYVRKKR
jgi:hypothetical protein